VHRLFDFYEREGLLERIVTRDETWVHHFEPESKQQTMQWKHFFSTSKKFKNVPSAKKVMMIFFSGYH
jgi:hypothetical protein